MSITIQFGESTRRPAPVGWGCTNLYATPILNDPLVVEHHYQPGGDMPEHSAPEAVLCICVDGNGFVRVGELTSELSANQAVVWPSGKTHKLWTNDSSMTVLLVHFPGRAEVEERPPGRS
jgi:quercetin dioxygenase-like cupin family protein